VKRDFSLNEAMNVTADSLDALAGGVAGLARMGRPAEAPRPAPVPVLQQLLQAWRDEGDAMRWCGHGRGQGP